MTDPDRSSRLPLGLCLGYGLGSVGTGIYNTVPGLLLLIYMTDTLGVPAWLAGVGIFIPKLWDVITDPWMGSISDRTQSRFGRRRPWLLAGGLTLPILFAALFMTPDFGDPILAFVWVLVFYVLCATAYTVFSVPYIAMPTEMTDDYDEVTRLMAWRMALLTVGVLVSGALAPALVEQFGYPRMATIIAATLAVAMIGTFFGTRRAPQRERLPEQPPFWSSFRAALRVKPFVILGSGYFLQHAGVGAVLAAVPYFANYTLDGGKGTVTILFVCLVGPAFATMPLWVAVSQRIGKHAAYIAAMLLFGLAAASLWFATPTTLIAVYVQVALVGVGWAGTELFPFSMLPDVIAADRHQSGTRREGTFTGLWMAIDKSSLALGGLLTSLALAATGFIESKAGEVVAQPDSALFGIRIGTAAIPALFVLACLPIILRYNLSREASQKIYAEAE